MAEAVEELYFSLGQNIYSHLSDIHSNRYEGIAKYLKSSSGSSYEPMWRQRNALFKMTASGRKMSIFKIRSSSTASAKSGHCAHPDGTKTPRSFSSLANGNDTPDFVCLKTNERRSFYTLNNSNIIKLGHDAFDSDPMNSIARV